MGHFEMRYDSDNVSGIHIMAYHVRINLMNIIVISFTCLDNIVIYM